MEIDIKFREDETIRGEEKKQQHTYKHEYVVRLNVISHTFFFYLLLLSLVVKYPISRVYNKIIDR